MAAETQFHGLRALIVTTAVVAIAGSSLEQAYGTRYLVHVAGFENIITAKRHIMLDPKSTKLQPRPLMHDD